MCSQLQLKTKFADEVARGATSQLTSKSMWWNLSTTLAEPFCTIKPLHPAPSTLTWSINHLIFSQMTWKSSEKHWKLSGDDPLQKSFWDQWIVSHNLWVLSRSHMVSANNLHGCILVQWRAGQELLANFVFLSSATSDAMQVCEADWSWLKNKSMSVQACANLCSYWSCLEYTRFADEDHSSFVTVLWGSHRQKIGSILDIRSSAFNYSCICFLFFIHCICRFFGDECYDKGLILCHNGKPYSICLFCLSYPLCKIGIWCLCLSLFKVDQAFCWAKSLSRHLVWDRSMSKEEGGLPRSKLKSTVFILGFI